MIKQIQPCIIEYDEDIKDNVTLDVNGILIPLSKKSSIIILKEIGE